MTDIHRLNHPARRSLPLPEWPATDRRAWEAALAPGDVLDGTAGAAHHWRPGTRVKNRNGYGRWLTFLHCAGLLATEATPDKRVTQENVRAYIAELRSQNVSSWTLWARLVELYSTITVMAPEGDLSWLWRATRAFALQREAQRNKRGRLKPAHEVLDWALRRMDELRLKPSRREAAGAYRDALQVALLSACPIRLGNLAMIVLDRHLLWTGDGFALRFTGAETKSRRPIAMPVPDCLTEPFNHYINVIRPELLGGQESDRLWITRYGAPMPPRAIHAAIARTTRRAFGQPINPHLFRDGAATHVALEDPEHVGIVSPLLGHVDPRTAERHYIQANQIAAGRRVRGSIAALRQRLGKLKQGGPS
jgi:integrase/recombinase XerD